MVPSPLVLALVREEVVCLAAGGCHPNHMEVLLESSLFRLCASRLGHTCQLRMFFLLEKWWQWGCVPSVGRTRRCVVLNMFLLIILCHADSIPALVGVEVRRTDVFCASMLRLES